jgi:hypothetical protein
MLLSELSVTVVWCLTLVWRIPILNIASFLSFFSFWYSHYRYYNFVLTPQVQKGRHSVLVSFSFLSPSFFHPLKESIVVSSVSFLNCIQYKRYVFNLRYYFSSNFLFFTYIVHLFFHVTYYFH